MVATTPIPAEQLDAVLQDFTTLHLAITALAKRHRLTVDALYALVHDDEMRRRLDQLAAIADVRTDIALKLIQPPAIDRLADIMTDESAPHETRRKAASQLIRLHTQRQRERERRTPVPPTAASAVGAPHFIPKPQSRASEPPTSPGARPAPRTPAAPAPPVLPPLPLGEAALGEGSSFSLPRPSPIAEILSRAGAPIRAP